MMRERRRCRHRLHRRKKKQPTPGAPSTAAPKNPQQANKKSNAEKENKASTLNKNESVKKANGVVAANHSKTSPKQDVNADGNRNRNRANNAGDSGEGSNRNVAFKSQNNNRRNVREGGEARGTGFGNSAGGDFNNDQQRPRPFNRDRDRDNRGPPRNRYGENSFRGKREFDRQSGSDKTGVKSVDKRDGAGAHNWGSVKQEIEEINKSSTDAETSLTDKEDLPNEQSTEQVAVPEEEETKEMTLDEWKAMTQQRSKPQFNLRKAGEGEDATQWNKMVVLNKKKEGGDSEEEFEYDPSLYPQRVGRLQRIVDIQFNFSDSRRSNGGSGGFGRGRGRGPRPGGGGGSGADKGRFDGAPRGGNTFGDAARGNSGKPRNFGEKARGGGPNSLKVDDERQFPTLS